jgi:general secretion pathway protein E
LLRQDPDVLFIGEIRDAETAAIAAQAAMTGHLVLATIHTNDAVGVVSRLSELGLPRATIAETLRGVMSQRLVRRLCAECVEFVHRRLNKSEVRLSVMYGMDPWVRTVGCVRCRGTGFLGRLPVCEVLVATPPLKKRIASGGIGTELHPLAVDGGMRPIRNAALELVCNGETSLAEIDRVLGNNSDDTVPPGEQFGDTFVVKTKPIIFREAA